MFVNKYLGVVFKYLLVVECGFSFLHVRGFYEAVFFVFTDSSVGVRSDRCEGLRGENLCHKKRV